MATWQWYARDEVLASNPLAGGDWFAGKGRGIDSSAVSEIISATTPIGALSWRVKNNTISSREIHAINSVAPQFTDGEVLVLARIDTDAPITESGGYTGVTLLFRHDEDAGNTYYTAYGAGLRHSNLDQLWAARAFPESSSISSLGLQTITRPENNGWFYIRSKVDGTNIRTKLWLYDDPEPSEFQHNVVDANLTNSGEFGLALYARRTDLSQGADLQVIYISAGTGTDEAPLPGPEENLGLKIEGIKEPNEANALVTGVTNARVKVWLGSDNTGEEDALRNDQTIGGGHMEVDLDALDGFFLNDTVTVEVMWTVGTERKLFITETTVVDLEGGS